MVGCRWHLVVCVSLYSCLSPSRLILSNKSSSSNIVRVETNLACNQAVQETPLYIYVSFCVSPPCRCGSLPNPLIIRWDWYCDHFRAWTQQGLLSLSVKMINLNLASSRTRTLGLLQALTSTVDTLGFWYVQKYWKISTKKMASKFCDSSNVIVVSLIALVCCLQSSFHFGVCWVSGQKRLGTFSSFLSLYGSVYWYMHRFHNVWEFWAYSIVFGLFQAPYYAFSQTMMAELCPPGYDNMFFGFFGLSNRASSVIGPGDYW